MLVVVSERTDMEFLSVSLFTNVSAYKEAASAKNSYICHWKDTYKLNNIIFFEFRPKFITAV
jgi:hypothetical protein